MNRTEQSNRKNERAGRKVGLLFTVAAHAALFFVFLNVALQPEYSLPDNSIIVLDFQEPRVEPEPPKPIEVKAGNEPKAEVATPTEEVRLVQQSQAQQVGQKPVTGHRCFIACIKCMPMMPDLKWKCLICSRGMRQV